MVPSGASTGKFEALELRDGENRFLGKSVFKAIENVETEEDTVANNDASSAEEELSLKEKFKKAFNKDNVTIQL